MPVLPAHAAHQPPASPAAPHDAQWGTRALHLPNALWQRLESARRVVEIGCGTGHLLDLITRRCRGQVVGMDADLSLLRLAADQYPGLRLFVADAQQALALGDGTVEVALSSDVFEHLPDPAAHLREVWRVLQPGGLYLIKTPNAALDTPYWIARHTVEWRRRGLSLPRAVAAAHQQLRRPGSHCSVQTAGSLARLGRGSGFRLVQMVKQPPSTTQEQKLARLPQPLRRLAGWLSGLVPRLPQACQWSLLAVFQKPAKD